MPTWTLEEIMSQATARAGQRADIGVSTVSLWANQAYLDFSQDVPQLLLESDHRFSLSSGDSVVALPADWQDTITLSMETITQGSGRSLRPISQAFADSQGFYPVDDPQGYFVKGGNIYIWPSANSSAATTHASSGRSYLHRYRAIASDLVSTSSVPSVATEQRFGIVLKLEQYIHELVGNTEEAAMAEMKYTAFVAKLKDAQAKRQSSQEPYRSSVPRPSHALRASDDDEVFLRY